MLPKIPEGNTDHFTVMQWACRQGEFLPTPSSQALLLYLSANAFYREDNHEGGALGQVLFAASSYEAMRRGTGIKSNKTLQRAFDILQEAAYVRRQYRTGWRSQPLEIQVLWTEDVDDYRERLREGKRTLHEQLQIKVPRKPRRAPEFEPLVLPSLHLVVDT